MVRRCLCKRSTLSPEGVIGTSSIPFCGLMSEFRAGPCPVASISTTLGRYLRMNRQTAERDSRWVACSRHWSSNTCTPSLGHHAWITVKLFLGPPICPGSMLRTTGNSRTCSPAAEKLGKYFALMRRRSLPPGFCCWRVSKPGCFESRSRRMSGFVNASGRSNSPFLRFQTSPCPRSYLRRRVAISGNLKLPAALLQNVTGQIVFADAMRNDHDASLFGTVQTSLNLVVKKAIDTLQTIGIVAVFDLDRVINDDEIGTEAGDPALDRERAHPAAICGQKVHNLGPIFGKPSAERFLKPIALQDRTNGISNFIRKVLAIGEYKDFG